MPPNELSNIAQKLVKYGYNAEPEVVQFINTTPDPTSTIKFLISHIPEGIFTLEMSHISDIYGNSSPPSPSPSISILNDMTGNSTGSGTYDDFVSIFQDRLSKLSAILSNRIKPHPLNSLGKNSVISQGCTIIGPAIIGDNCFIGNGVTIVPNVSIGNNSKILNCKIKDSIIMTNCLIDANISIEDSIITQNSEVSSNQQFEKQVTKKLLLGEGTKIIL